jgi:RimJ/RimL family protein N-acetyltransferase
LGAISASIAGWPLVPPEKGGSRTRHRMKTIHTNRLKLREVTEADAPFLVDLMNDPEYLRLIGDRGVRTEEDAISYLHSSPIYSYGAHGLGFNLVELADGMPIGICGLVKRDGLEEVDLGYAIHAEHSGKGYATEAASAVLEHAQGELDLRKVVAITVEENSGSRKVLERIGMHLERTFRPEGSERDTCLYTTS